MIEARLGAGELCFEAAVQPRASRLGVEGERAGALRVRLTAPPAEGAANRQCIAVLAKALGVPKGAVEIVAGAASRRKRIRVRCENPGALEARLRALASGAA